MLLAFAKEPGFGWRVGQAEEDQDAGEDCDRSVNEEDVLSDRQSEIT